MSRAAPRPNSMPSPLWPMHVNLDIRPRSDCCRHLIRGGVCAVADGCERCCSTSPMAPARFSSTAISFASSARMDYPRPYGRSGPRHPSASAIAMPNTANSSSSNSTAGSTTIHLPGGMRISNGISTPLPTAVRQSGSPIVRSSTGRVRPRARSLRCCSGMESPSPAIRAGHGVSSLASTARRSRQRLGLQSLSSSNPRRRCDSGCGRH